MDISFVMTTRNDGYGGTIDKDRDFTMDRLMLTCDSIRTLSISEGFNAEIVVVEYNPPADRPQIKDIVLGRGIRVITISPKLNNLLDEDNKGQKIPFYEYVAKDIGIRKALHEIVVACNPDNLFPSFGWGHIKRNMENGHVSLGFRLEVERFWLNKGIGYLIEEANHRTLPFFNISADASGDFITLTKSIYMNAGRYNMLHGLWGLDGSFTYKILALNIPVHRQYWHYHIHHDNAIVETRGSCDYYNFQKISPEVVTRFDEFIQEDCLVP